MNDKINQYLNSVFSPYDGLRTVDELKEELRGDLMERMEDLKKQGYDDETAYAKTIESVGDIEETIRDVAGGATALERKVLTKFSATNLPGSDFQNVTVHKGAFNASALSGADFRGADLTGSVFKASDLTHAVFDGANLTDANLSMSGIADASFIQCNLTRASFHCSDLRGVRFDGANLTNAKLSMVELKGMRFQGCILTGTDFSYSDLSDASFEGLVLSGTVFDKTYLGGTSFRGATLRNVSFHHISKKSARKAIFDGATMDKLTYALLKGSNEADLDHVTVI